ncbi:class I SAM-dependent methyltransferase [Streptomyces sp. NPDC053048]|uniref:class I SAM-dependent methyltransferase n=1 Tax=Streptomyces sp. NPDC053048 TaxID=3365694 RepID=UPI0037D091E9
MYESDFAAVYDDICRTQRDYAAQAARTLDLVRARRPDAASLLDVGCGTGEELVHLREHFEVTGVDLSEPMVRVARAKLEGVEVHRADMLAFDLGRTFDVVGSFYSAVGYLADTAELGAAVRNMAAHLVPGGILVVEPFFLPERWNGGDLVDTVFEAGGRRIARMGKWHTEEGRCHVAMHYLVGDPARESGEVRHFVDRQTLTLFGREDYERAFTDAGCTVEFLPDGYLDRGVFIGVRRF